MIVRVRHHATTMRKEKVGSPIGFRKKHETIGEEGQDRRERYYINWGFSLN